MPDKDGDTVSRGDILIGGEPIDIELTDDGTFAPPPVLVVEQNGKGTRPVATTTHGKPILL